MAGERTDCRKLKEIDQRNLASQRVLQFCVNLGNRERMGAEVKKVSLNPTSETPNASFQAEATARSISLPVSLWDRFGVDVTAIAGGED